MSQLAMLDKKAVSSHLFNHCNFETFKVSIASPFVSEERKRLVNFSLCLIMRIVPERLTWI